MLLSLAGYRRDVGVMAQLTVQDDSQDLNVFLERPLLALNP